MREWHTLLFTFLIASFSEIFSTRSGMPSVNRMTRSRDRSGSGSTGGSVARCFPLAFSLSMIMRATKEGIHSPGQSGTPEMNTDSQFPYRDGSVITATHYLSHPDPIVHSRSTYCPTCLALKVCLEIHCNIQTKY